MTTNRPTSCLLRKKGIKSSFAGTPIITNKFNAIRPPKNKSATNIGMSFTEDFNAARYNL